LLKLGAIFALATGVTMTEGKGVAAAAAMGSAIPSRKPNVSRSAAARVEINKRK
jgi:hypothetical protein